MDIRQTKKYAVFMKSIGWQADYIEKNYIYIKKIPLLGNFIKIQRPPNLSEKFINKVITKYKPFQLVIEPSQKTKLNFHQSSPYLPSKTIQIDLTQPEDKILANINKKTRYSIRQAEHKEVKISLSKNINAFNKFWHECRYGKIQSLFFSQKNQIIELYKAFKPNAFILNAEFKNEVIAADLLILADNIAYYFYAAATPKGKSLQAPSLLVWESIKLAKSEKAKIFDFEGIYDDRFPIESWKGFTHFKKSFGGKVVSYPGAFKKTDLKKI
jgi:lipid II:glycine glycyltransferase (peptidoglycan interpeptide bridge formation enzyme)